MEVFIKVWDEIVRDFKVGRFESEYIVGDLSLSVSDVPPNLDVSKVRTSFEYRGKRYWSSDEKEYIQLRLMR
jgi:hypothetical protein